MECCEYGTRSLNQPLGRLRHPTFGLFESKNLRWIKNKVWRKKHGNRKGGQFTVSSHGWPQTADKQFVGRHNSQQNTTWRSAAARNRISCNSFFSAESHFVVSVMTLPTVIILNVVAPLKVILFESYSAKKTTNLPRTKQFFSARQIRSFFLE